MVAAGRETQAQKPEQQQQQRQQRPRVRVRAPLLAAAAAVGGTPAMQQLGFAFLCASYSVALVFYFTDERSALAVLRAHIGTEQQHLLNMPSAPLHATPRHSHSDMSYSYSL